MLCSLLEDIAYQNKGINQVRGKIWDPENGRFTWKKGKGKSDDNYVVHLQSSQFSFKHIDGELQEEWFQKGTELTNSLCV